MKSYIKHYQYLVYCFKRICQILDSRIFVVDIEKIRLRLKQNYKYIKFKNKHY